MITVVGSFVVDLTARTPHMPVPGETVLGRSFKMGPGGKGGNQATAAARVGSKVNMITKLGKDEFGDMAIKSFTKDGINMDYTPVVEDSFTGTALIIVDDNSENMIAVTPGACGTITKEEVYAAEKAIKNSQVIVMQLETSNDAVAATAELAGKYDIPLIFNPAPYHDDFPREILQHVTYATPNETEAGYMAGGVDVVDDATALEAAAKIQAQGVKTIVMTLGKRGCLVYESADKHKFVDAFKLDNVVDTTGAGDAFNGGFAHAIEQGMELYEAVRYGNAVAGLSVTKFGTAPAMPTEQEVADFLASQK